MAAGAAAVTDVRRERWMTDEYWNALMDRLYPQRQARQRSRAGKGIGGPDGQYDGDSHRDERGGPSALFGGARHAFARTEKTVPVRTADDAGQMKGCGNQ